MYFVSLLILLVAVMMQVTLAEVTPETFDSAVVNSDKVWVVKFYSSMCGACQEFQPTWDKLKGSVDSVEFAEINIDKSAGMKLAESFGALNEGIPNVKVFAKSNAKEAKTIFKGEGSASVQKLVKMIKSVIKGELYFSF